VATVESFSAPPCPNTSGILVAEIAQRALDQRALGAVLVECLPAVQQRQVDGGCGLVAGGELACPVPKLARSAGLRFRTSSSGSAILTDQTADGVSSLYSSREIDRLGRIVKGLA
jgi:hypothetical protein